MINSKGPKNRTAKEIFLIESLKTFVDGIAATFGSRCEVVLHDLRNLGNLNHSIVKIANGHVTGRNVGGPITDQGLRDFKSDLEESLFINYPSVTEDGRPLKSSSIILRDENKQPIAALCINFDLTDIVNFNAAIQDTFKVSEKAQHKDENFETFHSDAVSTLNDIAEKAITKSGKAVPTIGRKDKIEIIRQLDEKGFFLIKGAIRVIAAKLNVSKYTIYNYLDQVHTEQRDGHILSVMPRDK